MCEVCTVEKVELVFCSRWQSEGFPLSVGENKFRGSPHGGGERQRPLGPDDDGLVGKVDPGVSDETGGPALAVGQADAGRLVTSLLAQVTAGHHYWLLPAIDELGQLDSVDTEVQDAATAQLWLV